MIILYSIFLTLAIALIYLIIGVCTATEYDYLYFISNGQFSPVNKYILVVLFWPVSIVMMIVNGIRD